MYKLNIRKLIIYKGAKIIKKSLFVFVVLLMFMVQLTGCKFSYDQQETYTFFGTVTFNGIGLADVDIVDNVNRYATTDENGNFAFTTQKTTLCIFAEKEGYKFNSKTISFENADEKIEFVAQIATPLSGKLRLEEIIFTPTSIVSFPSNNFSYVVSEKNCVKFCGLTVFYNNSQIIQREDTQFVEKLTPTNILNYNDVFSFNIEDGKTNFKIKYVLRMYYSYDKNEAVVTEPTKIISVDSKLYDANLDENGYVYFSATGINSISSGYSYNISFVFKFVS